MVSLVFENSTIIYGSNDFNEQFDIITWKRRICCRVFLDFSIAFDTDYHVIWFAKLEHYIIIILFEQML